MLPAVLCCAVLCCAVLCCAVWQLFLCPCELGQQPGLACSLRTCPHCKSRKLQLQPDADGSVMLTVRQYGKPSSAVGSRPAPAAGKAKVELLCMRVSLSDVVGMLNKQMPEYIRHHRLAHHQLQVFREHREAVKAGQDGKVVISCDWSEKLTVERSVEIMSEHWHAQQIGILVACAYFKNKEGAYKEHTVYVMTDGKEQSAAITQAAVNQVVCYLLAEHDMDMRQLYMWSDGCAGQFKGAPAMRQHWGMAQRFSMPVWWSYGATAHFKGRHDSEGGVVKQWLRGIQVEWSETACACAQCMTPAPRGVCMRPSITKPFVAMPMFDQKRDDKHWDDECLTLLCSFAPDSVKQLCTLGKKLSVKMLNEYCKAVGLYVPANTLRADLRSAGCHDPDPPAVPPFTPPRPPRVQLLLSDTDELAAAACQVSNRSLKRSRGKAPPTALSAPGADTASPHTLPPAHQAAQAAQALLQELPEEGASRPCHCGKASLSLTCSTLQQLEHSPGRSKANGEAGSAAHTTNTAQGNAQQQQQQQQRAEEKGSVDVLSCGRPCHRQLPHCPHACSVACHAGPCTQASRCDQEVTVRCECKRQRAKWPCARVQQALQERRGACSYDATTPLRLLACGPECERTQQAGPTQPLASSQGGLTAAGVQGRQAHDLPQGNLGAWWARVTGGQRHAPRGDPSPADTVVAGSVDGGKGRDVRTVPGAVATPAVAAGSRGSKHLTRAERQALADQREAVRRRAEQMQKVKAGATWLAVVLLGLLLAWVVTEAYVDFIAQPEGGPQVQEFMQLLEVAPGIEEEVFAVAMQAMPDATMSWESWHQCLLAASQSPQLKEQMADRFAHSTSSSARRALAL
ncbi:hypothetical protein QJQ45_009763 [Haematococcus lacustris]|nr:hypothetical protein QJQ45_009763 [Haematococcus lacustris]